jgi:hypothetical protein
MAENELGDLTVAFGKDLSKVASDVASEGGKSIIRGLATLVESHFAPHIAKNKAKADAIRIEAAIKTDRALTDERRRRELEEIDHQAEMAEKELLVSQRVNRVYVEFAREEANLQAIASASLRITEQDPDRNEAREIEEDWIFKFANYAQEVSDRRVQQWWSRILSSAAIGGKPLLSPAALQAMSLLNKNGANDFEKCCRVFAAFGFYPLAGKSFDNEIQDIDLRNLSEVGLIAETARDKYSFADFDLARGREAARFSLLHSQLVLTQRGAQIAQAVFGVRPLLLADEVQDKYIQAVMLDQTNIPFKMTPKLSNESAPFFVHFEHKSMAHPTENTEDITARVYVLLETSKVSERMQRLVKWAGDQFSVATYPLDTGVGSLPPNP